MYTTLELDCFQKCPQGGGVRNFELFRPLGSQGPNLNKEGIKLLPKLPY